MLKNGNCKVGNDHGVVEIRVVRCCDLETSSEFPLLLDVVLICKVLLRNSTFLCLVCP